MEYVTLIVVALIALGAGIGIGLSIIKKATEGKAKAIIKEAEAEAEVIKKDKILQAKEKFLQLKAEHEKHINEKNLALNNTENRIKQKEASINQKLEELKRKENEINQLRENLTAQLESVNKKNEEIEKFRKKQIQQLEIISGLSVEEAKAQLVEQVKAEAKTEAMAYIRDTMEEAKMTANKEAKKIVLQTIQRVATEHAIENSVTVFNIESDEIKGRIIGREGRNIRALEAATGVEIIVDDTPEAIILSCFDPVRRETARLALHQLVSDGRIHPARIEEVVEKTRKMLEDEIVETGKR
ncbi:MAG: Rnase Y domain-containing protein, partial [Bacteroidia bacterium]